MITRHAFIVLMLVPMSQVLAQGDIKSACRPEADVIFLMDGSDSIAELEFSQQRNFIRRFVETTDVAPDAVRVGVAVVSSRVGDVLNLNLNMTRVELLDALQTLDQPQEGSRTDLGLIEMEQLFSAHGRRGVLRIGVLLTDGRAKFERAAEAEAQVVKDAGVFLVAIGVGRLIKTTELEKLASTQGNAYNLEPLELSTRLLLETVSFLGQEACAGHRLLDLKNAEAVMATGSQLSSFGTPPLSGNQMAVLSMVTSAPITEKSLLRRFSATVTPIAIPDVVQAMSLAAESRSLLATNEIGQLSVPSKVIKDAVILTSKVKTPESTNDMLTSINKLFIPEMGIGSQLGIRIPAQTVQDTMAFLQSQSKIEPTRTSNIQEQSRYTIPLVPGLGLHRFGIQSGPGLTSKVITAEILDVNSTWRSPGPMSRSKSKEAGMIVWNDGSLDIPTTPLTTTISATRKTTATTTTTSALEAASWLRNPGTITFDDLAVTDQCSKGHFIDGVAYTFMPNSCTEFLQCFHDNGQVKATRISCPFETFFDEENTVCKHHDQRSCWRDPCNDFSVTSYAHARACRAYWRCEQGMSVPTCCPPGTSYSSRLGCTRNASCADTCMDFGSLHQVTSSLTCKLVAMQEKEHFYFEHVSGMGWMIRRCPLGSTFHQGMCTCKAANEQYNEKCKPEFYLDFNGDIADRSGNNIYMGNTNVLLDGNTGAFNGGATLTVWRFSGMSFGQQLTISFRFRLSVTARTGKLMHIVSNCCLQCQGEPKPSLDIALIPGEKGGIAVFSITTAEAGEIFLFVPYQDTVTGWNKLEYRYDGREMSGTVNKDSASRSIIGSVLPKTDALLIGSCGPTGAFDGFLDEFKFYMCNPE
ncbi:uncharacterized protein LOC127871473 [Dreissena polymorpha]|uniref:Uncharacterized protein n=1 Tax=Dreissena polymorpha TaxID=45954 RepID=A0A9D4LIZ5_DREPO|nr:uncharacterized protein LOC127871473 [Dreissena polymorpha]KAH3857696.1 hypothetical protein DPMN_100308 [Dreissena polymorpha]